MFKKNYCKITNVETQKLWSIDAVKTYLRISHDYDDELINSLIEGAISAAEHFTSLTLLTKEVEFCCNISYINSFALKYTPVSVLVRISVKNNHIVTNLETDKDYYLDLDRCIIKLKMPLTNVQELVGYYIAGFNEHSIPAAIKHGILLHIAEMYDREDGPISSLSPEIKNLYLSYKRIKL